MSAETNQEKLQRLLRDMFQFDCSDLDFGIYRIMNLKREAIEAFIRKDLLEAVGKELSGGILHRDAYTAAELKDLAEQIAEALGEDAIDGDGNLAEKFHGTPLGKRYLDIHTRAMGALDRPALEAAIFNHLHTFFGRYYDAGDFLSKRRYSRKEKYAIPYNGEEVYLHWANSDQYYIKTGEYFTDYRFNSRGIAVHFRLRQADVPQNNVKGEKRVFIPLPKAATFDAQASEIIIPFEFRPLTEGEQTRYGQRNQQEAILAEAVETIPLALKQHNEALAALIAPHHTGGDGEEVTVLAHHLRQYTRKNTSDFFIHKDLKGFLTRELDFYLKNEVLRLDELAAAGETRAEGWFQLVGVIRGIGGRIIEFLAQIEDFQKMLFEKRKFITETRYCITVGSIAEQFHGEIAANEAQWAEWKDLFHIDEEKGNLFTNGKNRKDKRIAFLKGHPTLVLDTRHFDADFVDRLLATFDNLDEVTDGLLIHSENFQALSLLQEKYREKIKCVYIDPPYNTGEDDFSYKDQYQHSCWLSMMEDRLKGGAGLLTEDGVFFTSIDDTEVPHLWALLRDRMGSENYLGTLVWKRRSSSAMSGIPLSLDHEYVLAWSRNAKRAVLDGLTPTEASYPYVDSKGKYTSTDLTIGMSRDQRPNQFYVLCNPTTGVEYQANPERVWRFAPDTMEKVIAEGLVIWPDQSEGSLTRPRFKTYFDPKSLKPIPLSSWIEPANGNGRRMERAEKEEETQTIRSGMNQEGGRTTGDLLGGKTVSYPKPVSLVNSLIRAATRDNQIVMDFFAGSGTTAHAAISANREESGRRRFILVEMGEYFDSILLPRIKKVTFTPEWKDGKPVRQATAEEAERGPRIVKVIRLESYEDSLNNIQFAGASKTLYDFDDYLLQYMLKWETKESATLLNVEQLARPFGYKLHLTEGQETCEKVVDIPETFAYLLGLHVKTRRAMDDDGRRYLVYRGNIDHREVVVIWRDTAGWEKADYERDKKFVTGRKLTEGAGEVFVNGDSLVAGARSLDGVFKSRMFGGL